MKAHSTPFMSFDKQTCAPFSHSNSLADSQLSNPQDPKHALNSSKKLFRSREKLLNDSSSCSVQERLSGRLQALEFELSDSGQSHLVNIQPAEFVSEETSEIFTGAQKLKWCPSCRREATAKLIYVPTQKTLWASLGILLTGGVFGCFLLPYMSSNCQSCRLQCNNCGHAI